MLQPALERLAIEALQLGTLLLPPGSRRKLQLLLRMISRMSQNVDMPRLHDTIGTRTLVRNNCVLSQRSFGNVTSSSYILSASHGRILFLFYYGMFRYSVPLFLCVGVNADGANILSLCIEL